MTGNPLELFKKFFGAVRAIFWFCGSFLAPEFLPALNFHLQCYRLGRFSFARNMPQTKTEVALQFSESYAAEVALQHSLFCSGDVIFTKSYAATSEKLQCNIEKAALQESDAVLPLSCGFQAPTFRLPRLGPAECCRG